MTNSVAAEEVTADRRATMAAIFASESSFVTFYERALPRIYGYLYDRCGGDEAVAEELTQQTFVAAVRERSRFDGRADVLTWLTAIARHKLADHYRRLDRDERRHIRLVAREIAVDPQSTAWNASDQREAMLGALAGLPALQRAALVLHYADGLPVRAVAHQLGKSESAIESLMTRAREALRQRFGEQSDV